MEEHEDVNNFVFIIKELKDNLGDISEKVFNIDLVTITLKGMLEEYHMFVTSLAAREKALTFEALACILLQEEERRKNLNCGSQNLDLALLVKGKQPYKGKPWDINKGGKPPHGKPHQGMTPPKTNAYVKKSDGCFYYGKFGHYPRDCPKKKYDESKCKNTRHIGHFANQRETMNDGFKILRLFVS